MTVKAATQSQLRTKLREVYSSLSLEGRITTGRLVEEVARRHPDLVEQEKSRLYQETMAEWAGQLMRREPASQLMLPFELAGSDLPRRLPLRLAGKRSGPAIWTLLPEVTFRELDRYVIDFVQTPRIKSRDIALERIRDYLAPLMKDKRKDDPIGPTLASLAKEEKERPKTG